MLKSLQHMALKYSKLKPVEYIGAVNITIEDKSYHITMAEKSVDVQEGLSPDCLFAITMNEETYQKLQSGIWNGLTAGGKSKMSDSAPLEFVFPQNKSIAPELLQIAYHLGIHFFSSSYPSIARFGPQHTRVVHGGNAAVLAYGHGVRSAYYCIKEGQQINSDERDPWWQCFTIIGGSGVANIDGQEVVLHPGLAVHVPPNVIHTFRADAGQLLEIIWIAYGNQA